MIPFLNRFSRVAYSWKEYEDLAVSIGNNKTLWKEMRQHLVNNRETNPLFDTQRFVRNLEKGFEMAFQRWQNDLPPDHIYVEDNNESF